MPDSQEQRERLSKAMGAAFLAHKVSELEKSVDNMSFSRDLRMRGVNAITGKPSRGGGGGGGGGVRRAENHRQTVVGLTGGRHHVASREAGKKRDIRVLDASALVHALPLVKRWVRENKYHLVVPLQAFSTLDILKRAPIPIRDQAREATRFLESQLEILRRRDPGSVGAAATSDSRIRLRSQGSAEELTWTEVQSLFALPTDFALDSSSRRTLDSATETDSEEDLLQVLPTASDIPRQYRSHLQCVLHFHLSKSVNHQSRQDPVLVVFTNKLIVPPLTPQPVLSSATHANSIPRSDTGIVAANELTAKQPTDYLAISSGDHLAYYAETFFKVPTHKVTDEEVHAAIDWMKAQSTALAASKTEQQNRTFQMIEKHDSTENYQESGSATAKGGSSSASNKRDGEPRASVASTPAGKSLFVP